MVQIHTQPIHCPSFPWQHIIKCRPVSCHYTALCLAQEEPSSSVPPPVAVTTAPHAASRVSPQWALSLVLMSLRCHGPARHRGNNGRTHPRRPTPTPAYQHPPTNTYPPTPVHQHIPTNTSPPIPAHQHQPTNTPTYAQTVNCIALSRNLFI